MSATVHVLRPDRAETRRTVVMDKEQTRAALAGANALERIALQSKNAASVEELRGWARELRTLANQWALGNPDGIVS